MEEKYVRFQRNDGKMTGKVHILEGEDTRCELFSNNANKKKGLMIGTMTTPEGLSYHEVEKPEQNKPNHYCGACFNIKKKKKKKKKLGKLPKVIPTKTGTPRNHKNKYRWYE
tara:strand:+ start:91 stop:426 length:336 start_codon:yes stop_codon:yes gene_type:complete